jgi:uncharacterized protein
MSSTWYSERADGVSLTLKVKAHAKRNALEVAGDALRVEVRAPALEGRANAAVIALLAARFGCPRSRVVLLQGEHASRKVVLLSGLSAAEVLERVAH